MSYKKKNVVNPRIPEEKETKVPSLNLEGGHHPVFHFEYVDRDGPFAFNPYCSKFKSDDFIEKIINFSSMTWMEIARETHDYGKSKHHYLKDMSKMSKDAIERLKIKKLDDLHEELYSFAFTNLLRIIGLREGDNFYILWYDSKHEVYPSAKKHT